MTMENEKPAPVATGSGLSKSVRLAGERLETTPKLTFTLGPDRELITTTGREAETLRLLIKTGPRGFTSGEASSLGWARRTSHYIFRLRRRGVEIETVRELIDGARVGRYVLKSPVVLIGQPEARSKGA